jgi:hypothetical protein
MTAVSNTIPLILLEKIEYLSVLCSLFEKVICLNHNSQNHIITES